MRVKNIPSDAITYAINFFTHFGNLGVFVLIIIFSHFKVQYYGEDIKNGCIRTFTGWRTIEILLFHFPANDEKEVAVKFIIDIVAR